MNFNEIALSKGFELLQPSTPGGAYQSVNIRGNIIYLAIQFPIKDGEYLFQGRLGKELSTADGYKVMQLAALNAVSQLHYKVGIDRLEGINHIDAYFQASETWDDGPKVVDGASELLLTLLGTKGTHSRAIFGVHHLPRNFSVGITLTATLNR